MGIEIEKEEYSSQFRYQAKLVTKEFDQNKAIDFEKIFSFMVNISYILELATNL